MAKLPTAPKSTPVAAPPAVESAPTVAKTEAMAEGAPSTEPKKVKKSQTALERIKDIAGRASKYATKASQLAKRARLDKKPIDGLNADALAIAAAEFEKLVGGLSSLMYFAASPGATKVFVEGETYQLSPFAKPNEKAKKQYAPGDVVVLLSHIESDDGNITLSLDHKGFTSADGSVTRPALGTIHVTGWSKIEAVGTDHSNVGKRPRKAKDGAATPAPTATA